MHLLAFAETDWSQLAGGGIAGVILAMVFSFVKPILAKRNGNSGDKPASYWEDRFEALGRDVQKGFDDSLRISVIPILNRQTDILDEMRQDGKDLSKAILRLAIRDEEARRAKGAGV